MDSSNSIKTERSIKELLIAIAIMMVSIVVFISVSLLLTKVHKRIIFDSIEIMTLTIGVIYLQSKYALKEIDFGLGRDKLFTTVLIGGIGGLFVSVANIKYYFSNAIIHTGNFKFDEYVAVESGYIQVVLFIIFTAIIIPILEEIIFRGFIYRILKNKYDWFWASIVTTIAFGLFHANIVTAIIQSIIFIIILEKSKSLGACILAHIMTNAIYCLNIYTNYGG